MKWWKRFWRIRRQDDVVKLIVLFFSVGIGFLINILYNGVILYQMVKNPTEYVLIGDTQDGIADSKMTALCELEHILAVSHMQESSLSVKANGENLTFSCTELSEEYIENVYGIRENGAMKVFYMNQKAYKQLKQKLGKSATKNSSGGREELQIRYLVEEMISEEETVQREKTAKAVLVKQGMPEDFAYVFCKGGSSGNKIRVYVEQQDLDSGNVEKIQNMGFGVENREDILEAEYQQEMKKTKMGYGLAMGCISLLCAGVLWKIWRRGY